MGSLMSIFESTAASLLCGESAVEQPIMIVVDGDDDGMLMLFVIVVSRRVDCGCGGGCCGCEEDDGVIIAVGVVDVVAAVEQHGCDGQRQRRNISYIRVRLVKVALNAFKKSSGKVAPRATRSGDDDDDDDYEDKCRLQICASHLRKELGPQTSVKH